VGRGCLVGPVVAAAVILPKTFHLSELRDSKNLSPEKRYKFSTIIKQNALSYAVSYASSTEIDKHNILKCSILAMHRALRKLHIMPGFILVDGNKFIPYKDIPYKCIIKGDSKFASIASASILAKTFRDNYMCQIHHKYPIYNWNRNKGYPAPQHRKSIEEYGLSPYHRNTFKCYIFT